MDDKRYALFKRLLETWQADPAFRRETDSGNPGLFPAGESGSMREAIFAVGQGRARELPQNPYTQSYMERISRVTRHVEDSVSPTSFRSPEIHAYLQRIRNRCRMESRAIRTHPNVHYFPMAVELSRGCRVGCSFCGLMAERWTANAPYDRDLWRGMLQAAFDLLGPISGESPCYYATEPLDHPDYERFLADQEAVTGRFPQTTTAVADRDPGRIRGLMRLLGEERLRDQARLRFSIRTLPQFHRIMKAFSPEELVHVELLMNNPESVFAISDSGRSRNASGSRAKIRYSISCLAGVRVNLADRTAVFLEPVLPDEEHPCGYRILETAVFGDAGDFREKLTSLFDRHALSGLPGKLPVRIHPEVRLEKREGKILLTGDGVAFQIEDNPWNARMLDLLREGAAADDLLHEMQLSAWAEAAMRGLLNKMFQLGYIINT